MEQEMTFEEMKRLNQRPAAVFVATGQQVSQQVTTRFGGHAVALPEEDWPLDLKGHPMRFVGQIDLRALPVKLDLVHEHEFMTLFLACDNLEDSLYSSSAEDFCLRLYSDAGLLVALPDPAGYPWNFGVVEGRWQQALDHATCEDPERVGPAP